ncbi:MAG: AAA family ATPase [Candidatus Symbiobacter sp.]|nr:AAA family ATPase [Candidatus Symbiobacter sp.]
MTIYIKSLTLQGILSFAPDSPPIELNPLNVIIGPNGSGKSNFIDILRFITTFTGDLDQGFRELGGQPDFFWRGKYMAAETDDARKAKIVIDLSLKEADFIYDVTFSPKDSEYKFVNQVINLNLIAPKDKKQTSITFKFPNEKEIEGNEFKKILSRNSLMSKGISRHYFREYFNELSQKAKANKEQKKMIFGRFEGEVIFGHIIRQVYRLMDHGFFLRSWEIGRRTEIRRPQRTDDPVATLLPNCQNLGLVLNEIKNRDPELIYAPLRRVIPDFDRLNIDIIGGAVAMSIYERGNQGPTSAFRMSDGTLRFLAILAAIHCHDAPSILAIEEPEIGLHPDAIICLAELLVEASKKMQIFITTHSEVLLSAFRNHLDSVLVCENFGGQGTTLTHLDPDNLKIWLEQFSLGQVWRAGQIGGNP